MTNKVTAKGVNESKKEEVEKLAEFLRNSGSVTFVDYTGMSVSTQQELKLKLEETGGKLMIVKNTLLRLAGKEAGFSDEEFSGETFSGQTAMLIATEDAISPIQVLGKYISDNEVLEFKAGVVDGVFSGKEDIIKISKLPSREQLYANVVGAVAGPMYGIVGTLQGNLQKLLFILEQAKDKASGESAAA